MIDQHLLDTIPRNLCIHDREVCPEIIECCLNCIDLVTCIIFALPTPLSSTSKVPRAGRRSESARLGTCSSTT